MPKKAAVLLLGTILALLFLISFKNPVLFLFTMTVAVVAAFVID